jgi:hypothetical protein
MYVAAAQVFAVLKYQEKRMKIVLSDGVEIFDSSRRKLSGMRLKGEKLILERAFQSAGRQKRAGGKSSNKED